MKINIQSDWKDCGLYCLQSFYEKYFFSEINISYLKNNVQYGQKGINILELKTLAKKINLNLESFQINFEELLAIKNKKPFIALIKKSGYSHYVIVAKRNKKFITILDPSYGKINLRVDEFKEIFLNIILTIEKSTKIFKIIDKNLFLSIFWSDRKVWFFMILIYIFISILTLLSPYFLKLIIDKVIPNSAYKLLLFFICIFLMAFNCKIKFYNYFHYDKKQEIYFP